MATGHIIVWGVALMLPCLCFTYQKCLQDTLRRGSAKIKVTNGLLQGVRCPHMHNLSRVDAYKGIKFATLRQGRMRYMPPSSTERKWQGIRFQGALSVPCSQMSLNWSEISQDHHRSKWWKQRLYRKMHDFSTSTEECLYLNIFVPGKWTLPDINIVQPM